MTPSTVDLVIKNAKIFTFQGIITGGIAIEEGKIVKLSKESELPRADETIDAKGLLALPGLIDSHVHLRDMELSYKEDFYTGTCAAAAGGVTTIIDMPNTVPRTASIKALREKKQEAKKKIVTDVAFYAGFPSNLNEIEKISKEGIVGFKVYPHDPLEGVEWSKEEQAVSYFEAAARNNLPVAIHPDDLETVRKLQSELKQKKLSDIEFFLESHPTATEKKAIIKFTEIGIRTKCSVHICHVSSIDSLIAIKDMRSRGAKVTCEVTPHHLLLTKDDINKHNTFAKVLPPLRTREDNDALWAAILDGIIDILASDHAPHSISEKEKPFSEAPSGFPGLETMFPLMFTKVARGDLRLEKLVEITSSSPAKIFKIGNKGMLQKGYDADIIIVDTKEKWIINSEKFYSKSKFSPFNGWEVTGKVKMTFVRGLCVMSDEQIIVPKGTGNIINIRA